LLLLKIAVVSYPFVLFLSKQIEWDNRLRQDNGSISKVSVDGTDFRINQPTPFWKGWYSHKFKSAGVCYEVAISIQSGDIVWIHGPFPCGKFPDLTIFQMGLKQMLQPTGERTKADGGYIGEPLTIELPDESCFSGPAQKQLKKKVQRSHETVNARFKHFKILNEKFRHEVKKHKAVFNAIAVITQLEIEPLFQVRGYKTETLEGSNHIRNSCHSRTRRRGGVST
jgi:hypothetical protein